MIVRDLMSGPKRYTDLSDSLHGIGTSLLSARLKQLESDGVVERRDLPPPAASTVYQLTPSGEDLATALVPLALWGARNRGSSARQISEFYRPEWTLGVLARLVDTQAIAGLDASVDFHIDGSTAHLRFHKGVVSAAPGSTGSQPDAQVRTDASTLFGIGAGAIALTDALAAGDIAVSGDPAVLEALVRGLSAAL